MEEYNAGIISIGAGFIVLLFAIHLSKSVKKWLKTHSTQDFKNHKYDPIDFTDLEWRKK